MPDKTRRKARQTKDRVLQARIPEQLDDELRTRAEDLGLSVSTIVRNVLLNTFDLVEGVVSDSSQIARVLTGGRDSSASPHPGAPTTEQGRAPATADVSPEDADELLGWQEAILNKNAVCDECNAILKKGERAAIGLPISPRPVLLCLQCLDAVVLMSDAADSSAGKPRKKAPGKKRAAKKRARASTSAKGRTDK